MIELENITIKNTKEKNIFIALAVLWLIFAAVGLWLGVYLNFNFFRSDVYHYWQDSLEWKSPYNAYHVPGYPLLIALLSGLTFNQLPPLTIMIGINLFTYSACILLVYHLILAGGVSNSMAILGAFLFGLWPFVGVTHAVYPLADLPALVLLLGGLYAIIHKHNFLAPILLGFSMVVHKGLWTYAPLLLIAYLLDRKPFLTWQKVKLVILFVAPIGALWLGGSIFHRDPAWLVSGNLSFHARTRTGLLILDGLAGTVFSGGAEAVVKGGLMIVLVILTIGLLVYSIKTKPPYFFYEMAICVSTLFAFLVLNQSQIWAAVRFSRLLVLPLLWNFKKQTELKILSSTPGLWSVFGFIFLLIVSQFAFAWYMAVVYHVD